MCLTHSEAWDWTAHQHSAAHKATTGHTACQTAANLLKVGGALQNTQR